MNIETSDNSSENYIFTTPVNKGIAEILNIPSIVFDKNDEKFEWTPPKEHGLTNCNYIIPKYYQNPEKKILNIDYYDIIKDDIRNFRPLNKYQLEYIVSIEDNYKNELLFIFNECMTSFNAILSK